MVMLWNSDTLLSREIFAPVLKLRKVRVRRLIAASGDRPTVGELVGVSYPLTAVQHATPRA